MIGINVRHIAIAVGVLIYAACSFGSPSTFTVSNADVDASYSCPAGATNAHYDIHGTIDAHNGTSKAVTISTVDAAMTLAAAKGGWLQKVGDKYDADNVTFTPDAVGAGSDAKIRVTVPSACTGRAASSPVSSGEYSITFTIQSSAGTFKVDSKDRHRIVTA